MLKLSGENMTSNISNRTIFCKDNLDILKNINSSCIDLIYLDPPFNKNKTFSAPIGSSAYGASFNDVFREEDIKDEWVQEIKEDYDGLYKFLKNIKELSSIEKTNKHYLYNYCYLCYMAVRLVQMRRILKNTGSIYLHCDPTMSHYLKILLDIIFGEKNFRNEIVWSYKENDVASRYFPRKHDIIFFYAKSNEYIFNIQRGNITQAQLKRYNHIIDGSRYANMKGKMRKLEGGARLRDWWQIPIVQNPERKGYPTQKPIALLERIIQASSNEGALILDPFCGCATTCIASEKLNRKWIGIDVSIKAYELVKERLKEEVANPSNLLEFDKEVHFSTKLPKRTDTNEEDNVVKKYVYVLSNPAFENSYKVGIASNIKTRLSSYQTSDPNRGYEIEYKKHTHLFSQIEKYIHKKYTYRHEWVKGNLEDIIKDIKNYK